MVFPVDILDAWIFVKQGQIGEKQELKQFFRTNQIVRLKLSV